MTTTTTWATYAAQLADVLLERGDIRTPQWHAATAAVRRHVFVPTVYEQDRTGQWTSWDTAERWDRVYTPKTLVTALTSRRGYPEPASSSTNPALMLRMLETLGLRDGHRVLEIGTGTGYNAALLSCRLGAGNVYSIDIDPDLVALARHRLGSEGYHPTLAAADGHRGLPEHATYDRLIATCSVSAVPAAWTEQIAPGGSVLADLKLATSAGNLVHLHRQHDGTLQGRFLTKWASFMAMRHPDDHPVPTPRSEHGEAERRHTTNVPVPPWTTPVLWFLAQLTGLPRHVQFGALLDTDTHRPSVATLTAANGSWARIDLTTHQVTEAGPTSLWEPIERAHRLWTETARPGWERLGLTVDTHGHNTVWLDDPHSEQRWTLERPTESFPGVPVS